MKKEKIELKEDNIKLLLMFDASQEEPRKFAKFSIDYRPIYTKNKFHIHGDISPRYEEPRDYLLDNAAVHIFIKDNLDDDTVTKALETALVQISEELNLELELILDRIKKRLKLEKDSFQSSAENASNEYEEFLFKIKSAGEDQQSH